MGMADIVVDGMADVATIVVDLKNKNNKFGGSHIPAQQGETCSHRSPVTASTSAISHNITEFGISRKILEGT